MMKYSEGEIHFNLMGLVSDRKMLYERELQMLSQVNFIQILKAAFIFKGFFRLVQWIRTK